MGCPAWNGKVVDVCVALRQTSCPATPVGYGASCNSPAAPVDYGVHDVAMFHSSHNATFHFALFIFP